MRIEAEERRSIRGTTPNEKHHMIILGIDPGSTRIGYGIIQKAKTLKFVNCGVIEIGKRSGIAKDLHKITEEIAQLIHRYKPNEIGIEKLYFSKNIKTGIEVAQARGAIIAEIAKYKIPIKEFGPLEIKKMVTNYGFADKKAVAKMVSKILNIEKLTGLDDVSDALAIAISAALDENKF